MGRAEIVAIEAVDWGGCGLRAVFERRDDRFGHSIAMVQGDVETPLLVADGLPLQEIVEHRTTHGRRTLLATGAGNGRFWSVTVDPLIDARFAALSFDVACRDAPTWPAPAVDYQFAGPLSLAGEELLLSDGRRIAVVCGTMPVSVATEFVPTCNIESSPGQMTLRSNRSPHISTAKMARWWYEFQFARPH